MRECGKRAKREVKRTNEYLGRCVLSQETTRGALDESCVSPWPRKNFFRTPLNPVLSRARGRGGGKTGRQERRRRRSHTNVRGNLLYVPGKRKSLRTYTHIYTHTHTHTRESTKGNVLCARVAAMRDECEYISGIESTYWSKFGRPCKFQPLISFITARP